MGKLCLIGLEINTLNYGIKLCVVRQDLQVAKCKISVGKVFCMMDRKVRLCTSDRYIFRRDS